MINSYYDLKDEKFREYVYDIFFTYNYIGEMKSCFPNTRGKIYTDNKNLYILIIDALKLNIMELIVINKSDFNLWDNIEYNNR